MTLRPPARIEMPCDCRSVPTDDTVIQRSAAPREATHDPDSRQRAGHHRRDPAGRPGPNLGPPAAVKPRILAKLEFFSPGGSVKDRAALTNARGGREGRRLRPGQTVVELTSGNMGIGLAVACAVKGYRFTAVMSVGNSRERWRVMKALGARVVLVPQARGWRSGQGDG